MDGEKMTFYPRYKKQAAANRSTIIISCMLLLVLVSIGGVFTLKVGPANAHRALISRPKNVNSYPVFPCLQVVLDTDALAEEIVPSAVQAIVIQILNAVYRGMA